MEPEFPSPFSQEAASYAYPDPDESTLRPVSYFLKIHYTFPPTPRSF
jgi:hypothetical protein